MQTEMPCIGLGRQISNQKCLSEIAHHLPDDFITMNLFKIKGMLGVAHAMTAAPISNSLLTDKKMATSNSTRTEGKLA